MDAAALTSHDCEMVLPDQHAVSQDRNGDATPLNVTRPLPETTSTPRRSPFPPIADYAFLSDCEANCLIAPSGAGRVGIIGRLRVLTGQTVRLGACEPHMGTGPRDPI